MSKAYITAGSLCVFAALALPASAAPGSIEECLAATFEVVETIGQKKPAEADARFIEPLITRLESECAADKLNDAGKTIAEIKKILGVN